MDNHVPALDTFLHEGGTGLAGDHVLARLEEDGGRRLGAHQALLAHLPPVVHVLAADQALFHALRATFAELRNNSYMMPAHRFGELNSLSQRKFWVRIS